MKITKIWFEGDYIFGMNEEGVILKQPLRWYPRLRKASDDERANYTVSTVGFHWRSIDEDISFESFLYEENQPHLMYVE